MPGNTKNRGFASMDQTKQREISRKGGLAVSVNRGHMAEIGRKGGEASSLTRSQPKLNDETIPQT